MNIFFISNCCLHYKVFSSNLLKIYFLFFFDQFRSYLRVLVFYSFEFHSRMCVLLNCFVYTIQYQITHLNDYYLTISEARYGSKTFFSIIILQIYINICIIIFILSKKEKSELNSIATAVKVLKYLIVIISCVFPLFLRMCTWKNELMLMSISCFVYLYLNYTH